jgi:hypothetical protein
VWGLLVSIAVAARDSQSANAVRQLNRQFLQKFIFQDHLVADFGLHRSIQQRGESFRPKTSRFVYIRKLDVITGIEEIPHGCELRLEVEPNFLLGSTFATANGPAESEIVNKGTKSRSVCCSHGLSRMGGTDAQNGHEMHISMGDH